MIIGRFSCGLTVITHGSGLEGFKFESPFKSFVLTQTMAIGEFNAEDLYDKYTMIMVLHESFHGGRLRIYQGSFTHKVASRAQGVVVNNILRPQNLRSNL